LSRSEVARRAEVDPAMLFRIENADNSAPTFAAVVRIARVLGASLELLALEQHDSVEQPAAKSNVIDFEGRQALVTAARLLSFVIAGWRVGPDLPDISEPNLNRSSQKVAGITSVKKNRKK